MLQNQSILPHLRKSNFAKAHSLQKKMSRIVVCTTQFVAARRGTAVFVVARRGTAVFVVARHGTAVFVATRRCSTCIRQSHRVLGYLEAPNQGVILTFVFLYLARLNQLQ